MTGRKNPNQTMLVGRVRIAGRMAMVETAPSRLRSLC